MAKRSASTKKPAPKPAAKKPAKSTARGRSAVDDGAAAGKELGDVLAPQRKKIDVIDRELIRLLNERAKVVVAVGKIKRERGLPIYTPHRETEVITKALRLNKELGGLLPDRTIEGIYRELMSGSFRLERPPRIGFLGPKGSYSHLAAVRHFGSSVDFEDLHAIEGVFTEVARGHVDYGLVPIENSIGGGIAETLEAFQLFHDKLSVYAEVQIEVHHSLLAYCKPAEVQRIYSKPEVFAQCRTWLATQYPRAELVAEASSSRAVKRVMEEAENGVGDKAGGGSAAIGSSLAAELYNVPVLFEKIEDHAGNITRFVVISKFATKPAGADDKGRPRDKTSIMFTTADEPGALVNVLAVFQRAGINLSHIDKRPSGRVNWQYTFFIDAEGHIEDPWFAAGVKQAKGLCKDLHVLGSYPRSERIL